MRMRTVFLLLALAVADPAIAFRPRPVSDLRFEDWLEALYGKPKVVAAASDGDDYPILLDQFVGGTYAQVVSRPRKCSRRRTCARSGSSRAMGTSIPLRVERPDTEPFFCY